ncbi:isoamylase early set domain-containing protein [Fontisphaera persica]|uniref:isoamylase early set domain-containing protein n=1 Tax=Fontisphaera persica TaxID=2974023 RepID=UPI0024BF8DC0|nr:isoamylase early set domain-containing protein [Fontisphaera persica]WCJ60327.1 isoamylase early set domain-containing protein [Fontisphaera persica]
MRRKTKTLQVKRPCSRIEFHDDQAQAIFIGGTFNDWNPTATPMLALGEGRWVKALSLPPGRYEYCLVVDGEWRSDPAAAEQTPNVYGGFNSVLEVPAQHEQGQST